MPWTPLQTWDCSGTCTLKCSRISTPSSSGQFNLSSAPSASDSSFAFSMFLTLPFLFLLSLFNLFFFAFPSYSSEDPPFLALLLTMVTGALRPYNSVCDFGCSLALLAHWRHIFACELRNPPLCLLGASLFVFFRFQKRVHPLHIGSGGSDFGSPILSNLASNRYLQCKLLFLRVSHHRAGAGETSTHLF